ncbi:hypothetical protein M7I_0900 [Glarea lozoyensis 74030]|uniref:Uncharacterized protein n=1 Tax=Glarea lozoyensis (strain ATCC 74030 / MF5533) TaxID=1104152 RepID=H0EEM0_GLAL7|nr:hypothetical protein M7I_0900 [Glarea lozoyensis 74030]
MRLLMRLDFEPPCGCGFVVGLGMHGMTLMVIGFNVVFQRKDHEFTKEIEFDRIASFDGVLVAATAVDPELVLVPVDSARKVAVASVLDRVVVPTLADSVAKAPPVEVPDELSLLDLSTTVSTHPNHTDI